MVLQCVGDRAIAAVLEALGAFRQDEGEPLNMLEKRGFSCQRPKKPWPLAIAARLTGSEGAGGLQGGLDNRS